MRRVCLVAIVGCGRLNFGELSVAGDGRALDDSVTADACAFTAWTPPVRLDTVDTTATEYGPALSPDGQLLVYSLDPMGPAIHLWGAQRTGATTFGAPFELTALSSTATEYGASWNGTGDKLYFDSTRTGLDRLFVASYSGGTFSAVNIVGEFAGIEVRSPSVTSDDLEMFYMDLGAGATGRATRQTPTDPWQLKGLISELGDGQYASVSSDGLTIYFESARTGNREIYFATRPNRSSPFGTASLVTAVSDAGTYECDANISYDDRMLIFCSSRPTATGQYDLYATTRTCL
jgi:Tol biopolymer transport system component